MNKSRRWTALICALTLSALCGGAALADNGDRKDPLVTQSYLDQTVIPELMDQVKVKAEQRQDELTKTLEGQIAAYKDEMSALLKADVGEQNGGSNASYALVTLTGGQTMTMEVGCEVLLRVGSAKVTCGANPALIDVSAGGNLNKDTGLTKNHLYMATIPDRVLVPTTDTVKVLARGGYTVSG